MSTSSVSDPYAGMEHADRIEAHFQACEKAGVQPILCRTITDPKTGRLNPEPLPGTTGRKNPYGTVRRSKRPSYDRLAFRVPPNRLILDVDQKPGGTDGAETLARAETELGFLPETQRLTSRGPSQQSGRLMFSVPPGVSLGRAEQWLKATFGPGVDVLTTDHRFSMAVGDLNPNSAGTPVVCYGTDNRPTEMWHADRWPMLPDTWLAAITAYTGAEDTQTEHDGTALTPTEARAKIDYAVNRVTRYAADEDRDGAAYRDDLLKAARTLGGFVGTELVPTEDDVREMLRKAVWEVWGNDPTRDEDQLIADGLETGQELPFTIDERSPFDDGWVDDDPGTPNAPAVTTEEREDMAQAEENQKQLRILRARDWAAKAYAQEQEGDLPAFDHGTLAEILARDPEPPYRVGGLIPSDASTLIVAQRKVGKTTFTLNLAHALITGEPFLGRFLVRPVADGARVAILNYEVSAATVARWAEQTSVDPDRLVVVNLRGRRNPLGRDSDRAALAELLRSYDVETLIVDVFGRAYTGNSQNDNGEVQAFLTGLDRFARQDVGAKDLVLTTHAGWDGERSRGASALEDWPDSIVKLVKDDTGKRYMSAVGRDVEVPEALLTFEDDIKRLTLSEGTREDMQKQREQRKAADKELRDESEWQQVVELLTENPEQSATTLSARLGISKERTLKLLYRMADTGEVVNRGTETRPKWAAT